MTQWFLEQETKEAKAAQRIVKHEKKVLEMTASRWA